MFVIECTGRKPKDAIDSGLMQLGKTLTEVEVEILDPGGLFRKAKVRITVPDEENGAETPPPAAASPKQEREQKQEPKKPQKTERTATPPPQRREQPHREARKEQPRKETTDAERHTEEGKEPRRFSPVTEEVQKKAVDFVTTLLNKMDVEAKISSEVEEGELHIILDSEGSTLIGYHGEVLDAVEYFVNFVANREPDKYYHIFVDCNGYRAKRKESLIALAHKMAAKCLKIRHKVVLEPMNSNERKIIHSALADNDQIITKSEGQDPNRHIVILCKKR